MNNIHEIYNESDCECKAPSIFDNNSFTNNIASNLAAMKNQKIVIKHEDVCKQLTDIYYKKNHDYGNSFSRGYEEFGLISSLVRISDKYNRLVNLAKSDKKTLVKDESIEDTLLDMANYCILTYMEMKNNSK